MPVMASTVTESSPLLSSPTSAKTNPPRSQRSVSFNPQTTINHPDNPTPQIFPLRSAPAPSPSAPISQHTSVVNGKLRRRNSHGSPLSAPPTFPLGAKIGPQRTTKNAQKLKILPNPDPEDDELEEESGRDVYSQFTRIKDPTARRDAARLGKADRDRLPRVTAYCTASAYQLPGLMKFLKARVRTRGASPKQFDECIYTPYNYRKSRRSHDNVLDGRYQITEIINEGPKAPLNHERRYSDSIIEVNENLHFRRDDLKNMNSKDETFALENGENSEGNNSVFHSEEENPYLDIQVHTPEVFLFEYGTVVIWGMNLLEEQRFLKDISKFESEKLAEDDVQTENFNFYYTREYQARIYNDFISLREKKNYMTKLAISHALAQSVKTSLFEDLVSTTISTTSPLPEQIALTGSIALTRRQITMQIGQLFILRINIHLQGSVLDSPELMWAEPQLEPVYSAVRSYLEMDQRVGLLTERLDVIADLLAVLKDQVRTTHGEYLEWIVIILIAAEIVVAAVNILVDIFAGTN